MVVRTVLLFFGGTWFLEEVLYDGILVVRAVLVIFEGEMVFKGGGFTVVLWYNGRFYKFSGGEMVCSVKWWGERVVERTVVR